MNTFDEIRALLETRKNRVLTCAQIGMSEFQFKAFRKIFLDEFGKSGLESDLAKLLNQTSSNTTRQGTGRNTLCKQGGAP